MTPPLNLAGSGTPPPGSASPVVAAQVGCPRCSHGVGNGNGCACHVRCAHLECLAPALGVQTPSTAATHTRSTCEDQPADYCCECSRAAQEWVRWPCSPSTTAGVNAGNAAKDTPTGDLQAPGVPAPAVSLVIVAYGRPAPQGSKRHVGKGVMIESSKAVKPWREAVKGAALWQMTTCVSMPRVPLDGPLAIRMVFTMPKPKSAPKRRRTWPDRTPDLSKLCRATEDALTDAGVWADDALVVDYERLAKVYPGEDPESLEIPGVRIKIRRVTE